jgi:hypothetical protein
MVSPPKGLVLDEFSMDRSKLDSINYFNEWAAANGFVPGSTWSIDETVGRMDDPIPGEFDTLIYSQHWGERTVRVPLKAGMTWGDLWKAADKAIDRSHDSHHIFIEAFEICGSELELFTGS